MMLFVRKRTVTLSQFIRWRRPRTLRRRLEVVFGLEESSWTGSGSGRTTPLGTSQIQNIQPRVWENVRRCIEQENGLTKGVKADRCLLVRLIVS